MTNKTLVCILAETRAHALTWDSFKLNVLDTLDADLALCISTPPDYDFSNNYWTAAKYHWVSPDYVDFAEGFEVARQTDWPESNSNWRQLLKIKDQWLGGVKDPHEQHPGSGGLLDYYRWFLWKNIRDNNILDQYDRVIVTRSDFVWSCPHPTMDLLDPNKIWIPRGEFHGGLCDRHAVLSKANIEPYLNLIKPILSDSDNLYRKMSHQGCWNIERFLDMRIKEELGHDAVSFFPYIMYLVRPDGGPTRWSIGDWNDELGYFIKYRAEFDAARNMSLVIRNRTDWQLSKHLLGPR
jgi:hypothetical protein